MNKSKIVRALRSEQYRDSLSAAELAGLPHHPAGMVEIEDADLAAIVGGSHNTGCQSCITRDCNTCFTTGGTGCCC